MFLLRKIFPFIVVCLTGVFMCGCACGPPPARLKVILQEHLDKEFAAGLFRVDGFRRMGAYSSSDDVIGEERLLVYFDATLVFLRDYDMADWNSLGLEVLIRVLGAGPKGVEGIVPEGNRKGQRLNVHGSLNFHRVADEWKLVSDQTVPEASGDAGVDEVLAGQYNEIRSMLDEIGRVSKSALVAGKAGIIEKIHASVRYARNKAVHVMEGTPKELIVATGHVAGTYYPLGKALADCLTKNGVPSRVQQSQGSAENCRLVHHGYAQLAVCQNDVAFEASTGAGVFDNKPLDGFQALCSWYPEPVQILVLEDSKINNLSQLAGKTIVAGQKASGSIVNARQVLKAAGVDSVTVIQEPTAAGLSRLAAGEAAAVFLTEAFPSRSITAFTGKRGVRLLSLEKSLVARLEREHPFFVSLTIPANHYRGQLQDVHTVGVTATLIAAKKLDVALVEKILRIQYANLKAFIRAHPKGAAISLARAREGVSIPMHPGAVAFFRKLNH